MAATIPVEEWVEAEIRSLLSRWGEGEIFDKFIESLEFHDQGRAHGCREGMAIMTLEELRLQQSQTRKGALWAEFCRLYLKGTGKYDRIWMWEEVPDEVKVEMKLVEVSGRPIKLDKGIDLIARDLEGKYTAVQAKYRKRSSRRRTTVTWQDLSTFVGLVALSENWKKNLVMTNCDGASPSVRRPGISRTLAIGTFQSLPRAQWLRMIGDYVEHRCSDPSPLPRRSRLRIRDPTPAAAAAPPPPIRPHRRLPSPSPDERRRLQLEAAERRLATP